MKILCFLFSLSFLFNSNFPPNDIGKVSEIVHQYSKSADERNLTTMRELLHEDFRSIVNRAFGSEEIQLMDKTTYLDLMSKKIIGGDQRKVTILSIDFEEKNAVVKARLLGKKMIFNTFIQLVKEADGEWKIISDLPVINKIE